jgi:hypothetical protein
MRSYFDHHAITVKAHSNYPIDVTGRFLIVKETQYALTCQLDGQAKFPIEVGLAFKLEPAVRNSDGKILEPADEFKRITFFNDTVTDNDIAFYVGRGEINDYRINALISRIRVQLLGLSFVTRPDSTLVVPTTVAAGATTDFPGTLAGVKRRQIIVHNPGFDNDVEILDTNSNVAGLVFPRTAWTVETDDDLKVHNTETVDVKVTELFYAL